MEHDDQLSHIQKQWDVTLSSYLTGFILSLIFTGTAFYLTSEMFFTGTTFIIVIFVLAIAQATTQLVLFMHINKFTKPHWNLGIFFLTILTLLIIVLGSLWIMQDLNERVM